MPPTLPSHSLLQDLEMNVMALFDHPSTNAVLQRQLTIDTHSARLSALLRVYYLTRALIPSRVRQRLQMIFKRKVSDSWAFPRSFLGEMCRALEQLHGHLIIHPWPRSARCAVVLTHDVETSDGLRNVLRIAQIEEELGFRSSWNLVPYKYAIDEGIVRELKARSFEIGIHGYNHDGRLYSSRSVFEQRVPLINDALHRYGASGFRSPMVHRNLKWLQLLNIEYDASCFDIDPFQPMPGGVGSVWPFSVGAFVELPYTLPQDHTLWIMLQLPDNQLWEQKVKLLVAHHGMVLMLTHPDYLTDTRRIEQYRQFLITLRELRGAWQALPFEVTRWWREREQSRITTDSSGFSSIKGPARDRGVVSQVVVHDEGFDFNTERTAHSLVKR